jgi:hypothetical protein
MFNSKIDANLSQEQAAFATLLANSDGYKRVLPPRATPTLTQSGLLAVLFERQRYKLIQKARHAHREQIGAAFWRRFASFLHLRTAPTDINDSSKGLIGSVPRHI